MKFIIEYIVKERKDGTYFWSKASGNDKMWKRWVSKNYIDMEISFLDEIRDKTTEDKLGELFG